MNAKISRHAAMRVQQRTNKYEPYPRERLRELYRDSVEVEQHPQVAEGVAHVADDLVLVVRGDTVATVLHREAGR